MKPSDEIVEKLRKILTLAGDRAAQPGEVEAAMAKARELAIRHSIDLASIEVGGNEKANGSINVERDSSLTIRSKYQQPYHRWVYAVLQDVFEVRVILSSHSTSGGTVVSRIHIVGETVDIAIAVAVFPYLEKVFPAILSKAVSSGILTYKAADMNGCYRGIYMGIREANEREKAKLNVEEKQCYALVVRNKETAMKELFLLLQKARKSSLKMDMHAMAHGYHEGKKINLRQIK